MAVNNYKNKKRKGAKKPQINTKTMKNLLIYQKQRKCIKKYELNAQFDHFLLSV